MVFVGITPFPPRRIFVLVAALFALSIASCFAQPILLSAKITPYDRQMARIQPVLNTSASVQHAVLPLSLVNQWIGELRTIPYSFSMDRKTPTCRITLTLAIEDIEQRQQLRCTHVYNRVRKAAKVPRNRSALITSFVAVIGDPGSFVLRCGMVR